MNVVTIKYNCLESAQKAAIFIQLRNQTIQSICTKKFKDARATQKEIAKMAVENFDVYKTLPKIKYTNVPFKFWFSMLKNSKLYNIYNTFTKKTPEEKQFAKMLKDYRKSLTPEELRQKSVEITYRQWSNML